MRRCAKCGDPLPPPRPGGQRRYCETCSPPRPDRIKSEVAVLRVRGPVYDSTLRTLAEAGLVNHWRGAILLALAERIDADADSGSGLAALVRTYREVFARTMQGHQATPSPLDELRRRRQRKGQP